MKKTAKLISLLADALLYAILVESGSPKYNFFVEHEDRVSWKKNGDALGSITLDGTEYLVGDLVQMTLVVYYVEKELGKPLELDLVDDLMCVKL